MKLPTGTVDWFAIDFITTESPQDYVGDYAEEGNPMIYGSPFKISPSRFFDLGSNWEGWIGSASAADQWVTVKIEAENATTAKVNVVKRGKEFDESKAQSIDLTGDRGF